MEYYLSDYLLDSQKFMGLGPQDWGEDGYIRLRLESYAE